MKYSKTLGAAPLALLLAVGATCASAADSFSCLYGSRPACIDSDETVCSSEGKCVSDDAVCFDGGQCDYQGYTCRSNVAECVEDYDNLETRYNGLVDEYNELLGEHRNLMDEHLKLLEEAGQAYDDILALYVCLEMAKTLEEAQTCE